MADEELSALKLAQTKTTPSLSHDISKAVRTRQYRSRRARAVIPMNPIKKAKKFVVAR